MARDTIKGTWELSKDSREQLLYSCGASSQAWWRILQVSLVSREGHVHFQVWSRTGCVLEEPVSSSLRLSGWELQ